MPIAYLRGQERNKAERDTKNETGGDAASECKSSKNQAFYDWAELTRKVAADVRGITTPRRIPKNLMRQTEENSIGETEYQEVEDWSLGFSEYRDQQPDQQWGYRKGRVHGTVNLNETQIVDNNPRQCKGGQQHDI